MSNALNTLVDDFFCVELTIWFVWRRIVECFYLIVMNNQLEYYLASNSGNFYLI